MEDCETLQQIGVGAVSSAKMRFQHDSDDPSVQVMNPSINRKAALGTFAKAVIQRKNSSV